MDVFRRGSENYELQRYEQALADFQEASTLYASPDFLYNIALCYEKLGKREDAIRTYETYLRAKPDTDDRAGVEARVARLDQELAAERERAKTEAEAEARARVANQPAPTAKTEEPKDTSRAFIISGSVLAATGAALAIGGGVGFGLAAADRSRELDEIQSGGNSNGSTFAEASSLADEGKALEAAQITTIVVGAALVTTGGVLLAIGAHRRERRSAVASRWRMAPSVQRAGAGLAFGGAF